MTSTFYSVPWLLRIMNCDHFMTKLVVDAHVLCAVEMFVLSFFLSFFCFVLFSFFFVFIFLYRLIGLVVKASTSEQKIPGSNPI